MFTADGSRGIIIGRNLLPQAILPSSSLHPILLFLASSQRLRSKASHKSPEELEQLKKCEKVWNVLEVLSVLQALVDKSGIVAELKADGGADLFATDGCAPSKSNVLRLLGYFSLVGWGGRAALRPVRLAAD